MVATFITMEETQEAIAEALKIIKQWNEEWSPKVWMTDCAQSEINAIESVFKGI